MPEQTVFVAPDLDAISKEVFPYDDPYWNWVNQSNPAQDLIETTNKIPFGGSMSPGRQFIFPLRIAGSANPMVGVPRNQDSSGMPRSGKQKRDKLVADIKKHAQAITLDADVFDIVTGGAASTTSGFEDEMKLQGEDANKEHNRLLHGDGSGRIAGSITSVGAGTMEVDDNSRFQEGTDFIVRNITSGSLMTGQTATFALTVTAVNANGTTVDFEREDGTSVTLSGTVANFLPYRYDQQGAVIHGFEIIVSASNPTNWGDPNAYFMGMDAGAQPLWTGYRLDAGNTLLDIQSHIQVWIDGVSARARQFIKPDGEGVRWYAFCGRKNYRSIENALMTNMSTTPTKKIIKEHHGIEYEGIFFIIDDDAPPASIRFIAPMYVKRHVLRPWYWNERAGGSIWKQTLARDGRDADIYKATMITKQDLFCVNRLPQGEIYNTSVAA